MSRKIEWDEDGYTDDFGEGPSDRAVIVKDFLPPPDQLVPRDDSTKVTISLSRRSVEFFKKQARKNKVPYQRMIRALVDEYVDRHSGDKKW